MSKHSDNLEIKIVGRFVAVGANENFYVFCFSVGRVGSYLHSDGILREMTMNDNNEYTGYFDTREAAQDAINLYKSLEN